MSSVSCAGSIATSTRPRPCPVKILTSVYMCTLVTSDLVCVNSVVMYTLVLNTPHFYWCGACRSVLIPVQWCNGRVVSSYQFALSYGLVLGVVTLIALKCQNWTQKSIPVKLTAWEWLEEAIGTLAAGQFFDCQTYPFFGPMLVGPHKPSPCVPN